MNVVFAVGCRRYDDPEVAALKYAHRDAQRFAEAVASAQNPDDTEVFLLHEEQENTLFHPTRGNILRLLSRGARRDKSVELDFLYFFFSGHGFRSQEDDTDYLFATDSSASALEDTAISSVTLEKYIRRWEAKYTVLFIDACRAAAEGGKSIPIENASKIDVDSLCPSGMVTFCSCQPGQTSYEADAISSGVFTEGIFRALGDEGRRSTIEQLDTYLTDQIPRISTECGMPTQIPYSRVEPLAVRNALIVSQRVRRAWQAQEHKEATQVLPDTTTQEEAIRRYRENVESVWAGGQLNEKSARWLKNRGKALVLSARDMAEIERDVMGGTRKVILERQKKAAEKQEKIERQKRLDERYAHAKALHRAQDWRAVVGVFDQIRAEDPTYPDPEGLLNSARQALQRAEEKQDALRQYQGAVQSAWVDREINYEEMVSLIELAHELKLNLADATRIERQVMGDTKEAVQKKHYRKAVEEAWSHKRGWLKRAITLWWTGSIPLSKVKELRALANKLGLGAADAEKIEREILGETIQEMADEHNRIVDEGSRNWEFPD
jgi:uncharacterized caspase-like protein